MDQPSKSGFAKLAQEQGLYPQEAPAQVKTNSKSLVIGVPKEVALQERRVPLKPASVDVLVRNGHDIIIESGAGEFANFKMSNTVKLEHAFHTVPKRFLSRKLCLRSSLQPWKRSSG